MTNLPVREDLPLAVIVGACGGLGLACARRMGQRYSVALADIDKRRDECAAQLASEGIEAFGVHCDVTDTTSVSAMFDALPSHARIGALVHVVGLSPVAGDWRHIMEVNLRGAARVATSVLPRLSGGVGVFISSMAGQFPGTVSPALTAALDDPLAVDFFSRLESANGGEVDTTRSYVLSKYGLNRMCRKLARTWGEHGNRIVSLSPGLIATPMGDREFRASPQKHDLLSRTPLRRQGTMQEVADTLEFLCSARASFISGTDLLVDGGLTGELSGGMPS